MTDRPEVAPWGPFDICMVIELQPVRPKENEGATILNRGALIRMAKELTNIARDPNIEAVKIIMAEKLITIQRATKR